MYNVKYIKSEEMFPIVKEILERNVRVRITVTGWSMYPFFRDNADSVELCRADYEHIKQRDIVLVLRDNGQYVLHRVIKKEENCFYIMGDAQLWVEGPLKPKQLVAVVKTVWRGERLIECSSFNWVLPSEIWLKLHLFIYFVARGYRKLQRVI